MRKNTPSKKSPYQLEQERKRTMGISSYDPLLYMKPQVSESTKPKSVTTPDKQVIQKAVVKKSTDTSSTIKSIKEDPLLSEEEKTKILMNPSSIEENMYRANPVDPGTIKTAPEQSYLERTWDIATNPFDAMKYSISGGGLENMPRNYNAMREVGIDPSAASFQEKFGQGDNGQGKGSNLVGDALNTFNLMDAGQQIKSGIQTGDYSKVGLNTLRFLPYVTPLLKGGKQLASELDNLGVGNVIKGKAKPSDLFKREDLININTPEDIFKYAERHASDDLAATTNRFYSGKSNPDLLKYAKGQEEVYVHVIPQTKAAATGKSLKNIKPEGAGLIAKERSIPTIQEVENMISSGKIQGYSDETIKGLKEIAENPEGYWNLDSFKNNPELQQLIKNPSLVNPAEHLLPHPSPEQFKLVPLSDIPHLKQPLIDTKAINDTYKQTVEAMGVSVPTARVSLPLMSKGVEETEEFNNGGQMKRYYNNGGNMEQLTQFNEGGTHEESNLGGIPQGVNPDGQPNLVEEGETKLDSKNYVYSDSLKIDAETAIALQLSKSDIGKTFADISKKMNRPNSRRENDSIEEETKTRDLEALMEAQEVFKQKEIQRKKEEILALDPTAFDQQQLPAQMEQPQGMPPEMSQGQPMGDPMQGQPQIDPAMMQQMSMQLGGNMYNRYDFGGSLGAGVAGVASGIAGSLLPGPLGTMATKGIDTLHGALDKNITDEERSIAGFGKAAGAIGTGIATGGASLSTGFDDITSGLGQGISNVEGVDPKTAKLINGVAGVAGMVGGGMTAGAGSAEGMAGLSGLIPSSEGVADMAGMIPFNNGGYMYPTGGVLGDPPVKKSTTPAIWGYKPAVSPDYAKRLVEYNANPIDPKTGSPSWGSGNQDSGSTGTGGNYRPITAEERAAEIAKIDAYNPQDINDSIWEKYAMLKDTKHPFSIPSESSDMSKAIFKPFDTANWVPKTAPIKAIPLKKEEVKPEIPTVGYYTDPNTGQKVAIPNTDTNTGLQLQTNRQMSQGLEGIINTPEAMMQRQTEQDLRRQQIETNKGLINTMSPEDLQRARERNESPQKYQESQFQSAPIKGQPFPTLESPQFNLGGYMKKQNIYTNGGPLTQEEYLQQLAIPQQNPFSANYPSMSMDNQALDGNMVMQNPNLEYIEEDQFEPQNEEEAFAQEEAAYQSRLQESAPTGTDQNQNINIKQSPLEYVPLATNLAMGLFSKPQQLEYSDYLSKGKLTAPEMNINPQLRQTDQTFAQGQSAVRDAAPGSGAYLSNMQQMANSRNAAYGQLYGQKENIDAQNKMTADQFNIQKEQQDSSTKFAIDDYNAKAKANKFQYLIDAGNQMGQLGSRDAQNQMGLAYGQLLAPDYKGTVSYTPWNPLNKTKV